VRVRLPPWVQLTDKRCLHSANIGANISFFHS